MGIEEARSGLRTVEFRCGLPTEPPSAVIFCSRHRAILLQTCVQRVYLHLDADRDQIMRVVVPAPACTSF